MDDEKPDHDDGGPTCGLVRRPLILVLGGDDGLESASQRAQRPRELIKDGVRNRASYNDYMTCGHADSTPDEDWFTAPFINPHDSRYRSLWHRLAKHFWSWSSALTMNMAIPTTPVAKRETALEERPKPLKIFGA